MIGIDHTVVSSNIIVHPFRVEQVMPTWFDRQYCQSIIFLVLCAGQSAYAAQTGYKVYVNSILLWALAVLSEHHLHQEKCWYFFHVFPVF